MQDGDALFSAENRRYKRPVAGLIIDFLVKKAGGSQDKIR